MQFRAKFRSFSSLMCSKPSILAILLQLSQSLVRFKWPKFSIFAILFEYSNSVLILLHADKPSILCSNETSWFNVSIWCLLCWVKFTVSLHSHIQSSSRRRHELRPLISLKSCSIILSFVRFINLSMWAMIGKPRKNISRLSTFSHIDCACDEFVFISLKFKPFDKHYELISNYWFHFCLNEGDVHT